MSTTVINTQVSESRSVPRIWLEGESLAHAGIVIGVQYVLNISNSLRRIELRPAPHGYVGKTVNISKRTRNERVYPLIEVRDAIIADLFKVGTKLRVAIHKGRIVISMSHIAMRIQERVTRFLDKIKNSNPLHVVSLFHGGGVLDKAIHEGMQRSKLASYVKVAVELDGDYLDGSLRNNPELWRDDSTLISGDIRDVNILGGGVAQADLLYGGVPCTGASIAGVAKNRLKCAEEHVESGTLFVDFINWVQVTNPCIVVLENVVEYQKTAGMTAIISRLTHFGYEVSITVLDGPTFGSLEKRKRMCMVATTPGVCGPVDFENLVAEPKQYAKLAYVLEDIPADSPRWKSYDYLADKEERDKASGKGFMRQILTGEENGCGVLGRGYAKGRSTEPFIQAPHDPSLSRLMTEREHALVKTIPLSLIRGHSATTSHEILGQSVIFKAFVAVGELIAKTVLGVVLPFTKSKEVKLEETATPVLASVETQVKEEQIAPGTLPLFALTA